MPDRYETEPGEQKSASERTGVYSVDTDRSGSGEVIRVMDGRVIIWSYARHIEPGPGDAPEPVVRGLINEIDRLRRIEAENILTAERLQEVTGFELAAIFTGFARHEGYISPELHEERERLSGRFGEDNVLPSFFIDERGTTQLGLFVRLVD